MYMYFLMKRRDYLFLLPTVKAITKNNMKAITKYEEANV